MQPTVKEEVDKLLPLQNHLMSLWWSLMQQRYSLIFLLFLILKERGNRHKEILEEELHTVGLRLNQEPPNISFQKKPGGGIKYNATVPMTKVQRLFGCIYSCFRWDPIQEKLFTIFFTNIRSIIVKCCFEKMPQSINLSMSLRCAMKAIEFLLVYCF